MNTIVTAPRASPIPPANPGQKSAGSFASSPAMNFADVLGGEMKKSKSRAVERPPAEKEQPDPSRDPLNLLNASAGMPVTPPPQPEEPQRTQGEATGDLNNPTQASAAVNGPAPVLSSTAGKAQGSGDNAVGTVQNAQPGLANAAGEAPNAQLSAAFKAVLQGSIAGAANQPQIVPVAVDGANLPQPVTQANGNADLAQRVSQANGSVDLTKQASQVPSAAGSAVELTKKLLQAEPALNPQGTGFQIKPETKLAGARPTINDLTGSASLRQAETKQTAGVNGVNPGVAQPAVAADPLQAARVSISPAPKVPAQAANVETVETVLAPARATSPGDPAGLARALPTSGEPGSLASATTSNIEPARLAEAQTKNMLSQVSLAMETLVKSRQNTLRVMLYPEDMGRIDLRLTTGAGGLGIHLVAQEPATSQLLEAQLAQLRQSLDQAGIHLAHLSVGQQGSQANSGQADRQMPGNGAARGSVAEEISEPEDRQPIASLEPSYGYDYRV